MLKLHYSTVLARGRRIKTLKLKICHYESHIHLGVLHKTNAKNEQNFGRFAEFVKVNSHVAGHRYE